MVTLGSPYPNGITQTWGYSSNVYRHQRTLAGLARWYNVLNRLSQWSINSNGLSWAIMMGTLPDYAINTTLFLKGKNMTNKVSQFAISKSDIENLTKREKSCVANIRKGDNAKDGINRDKILNYSVIISSIAGEKLPNGNLTASTRGLLEAVLSQEVGCADAVMKKYIDNSVAALRPEARAKGLDIPSQATPEAVGEMLAKHEITTEPQLKSFCAPKSDVSETDKILRKLVGGMTKRKAKADERDASGNPIPEGTTVDGVWKSSNFTDEMLDDFEDKLSALRVTREAGEAANKVAAKEAARVKAAKLEEAKTTKEVVKKLSGTPVARSTVGG